MKSKHKHRHQARLQQAFSEILNINKKNIKYRQENREMRKHAKKIALYLWHKAAFAFSCHYQLQGTNDGSSIYM